MPQIVEKVYSATPTGPGPSPLPSGFVPVVIPDGQAFTVPDNTQVLFRMPITVDGTLIVDGYLIKV